MTPPKRIQLELIPKPKKPRSKPIKRAHIVDAGPNEGASAREYPHLGEFECKRCGWNSGWMQGQTITEMKRGIPCPDCNPATARQQKATP